MRSPDQHYHWPALARGVCGRHAFQSDAALHLSSRDGTLRVDAWTGYYHKRADCESEPW